MTGRPELLSAPTNDAVERAQVQGFLSWMAENKDMRFDTWEELHTWSVTELEEFWAAVWDYFGITAHTPYARVLAERTMPGTRWFEGATLNYAEHCFGTIEDANRIAVLGYSQTRTPVELTFAELGEQVRRVRAGLQRLGVKSGDRVVAYLPNIPETLTGFLAAASLGAIWAACAPEFGPMAVIDRFSQVDPTVMIAVSGYTYGDRPIDRRDEVAEIRAALPTLQHVIHVPYGPHEIEDSTSWLDLSAETAEPMQFTPVPFDHPLYVLFSSGTTGQPKSIVHRHGGILLEHLKNHSFHWDLGPGDRLLWFTTTAWMMWNTLASALLVRASLVMIDGNPLYPDLRAQWRLAEQTQATLMGVSPGYIMACRKEGIRPAVEFDLTHIRQIGAAGSPLPAEGFRWVHEQFGDQVLLNVGSGGTDVCTGLVQASPLQPVWVGQMTYPSLGVDLHAFDDQGRSVVGEVGELVITSPMPSMPVGFWGDTNGQRFHDTYFAEYPGVFRFGDWCSFSDVGSCVITGRSDATLNRGGVRLGTAEFYRVLQDIDEIADSVVVHLEDPDGGMGELLLFVVLADSAQLDDALRKSLAGHLRAALSPRHIPDAIIAVPAVPYSRTGKKLEVPVKKILRGATPDTVASPGALLDPHALDAYARYARTLASETGDDD